MCVSNPPAIKILKGITLGQTIANRHSRAYESKLVQQDVVYNQRSPEEEEKPWA